LGRLTADFRIALELRYWNGLAMSDMAEFLSIPVSTVKWRLYAAKQALVREMTRARSNG
jgi:DNA-directed RNA polymerase specialized sigma24 family protein